jgi:hypothetical protein
MALAGTLATEVVAALRITIQDCSEQVYWNEPKLELIDKTA